MASGFLIRVLLTVSIFLSIANAYRTVFIDPNVLLQQFEGFGSSLSWFASALGGFPDDYRNHIADLLFDVEKGLGLNVIRYNIGGGDDPSHNHMRAGAAIPGYLPCQNCSYNWTADANQRWFLFAAKERGADIFDAIGSSPPYWMTYSGCSSGPVHCKSKNLNETNNLNVDYYDAYADYLTSVVDWFRLNGLIFRTLDPFNEPSADYWCYKGNQEGCPFHYTNINIMTKMVGTYLKSKGLLNQTTISAADAISYDDEIKVIGYLDADAKSYISQYNTHAYGGDKRALLNTIAKKDGKKLWMSEDGLEATQDISSSIKLSEKILIDMRVLQPNAWVYWQAVEDETPDHFGWGLIGANFYNSTYLNIHLGFYAFAQYTKFIRPGYQIIASNDSDTLAAYSADKQTFVLVCTNKDNINEIWNLNVSSFNISSFTAYRTSSNETLTQLQINQNIINGSLTYLHPANSITTWVFSLVT